jgi:hypothetical protein
MTDLEQCCIRHQGFTHLRCILPLNHPGEHSFTEGNPDDWRPAQPTLRDQFAMAALGSMLGGLAEPSRYKGDHASAAYSIADAMLEARKVKP